MWKAKKAGQVTVGVFGLHPGAGATHLTILLSVFLSCYEKKKTLVIEESGKNGFSHFEKFLYGEDSKEPEFGSRRCRYQKGFGAGKGGMVEEWAEYLLFDLGCSYAPAMERLISCDVKWVIGSGGIFHTEDWGKFLERKEVKGQISLQGTDSWHFLQNHAATGSRRRIPVDCDGHRKVEAYGLGAEENLLHPSPEAIRLFSRMGIDKYTTER